MGIQLHPSRFRFILLPAVVAVAVVVAACGDREPAPSTAVTPATAPESSATSTGSESPLTDQAFAILKELTEDYSPRESTTEQELEASKHLLKRLKQLGYSTLVQQLDVTRYRVRLESSSEGFDSLDSVEEVYKAEGSAWGNVTAPLVDVGQSLPGDISYRELTDRIALIERGQITLDEKLKHVAEAGASGAIIFNNHRGMFYGRLNGETSIPVITVSQEEGHTLRDLAKQGELEVTISSGDETSKSRNVIALKRSKADTERTVIIGAHYDTVADTQGANDNGSGIATVLTIADQVAAREYPFNIRIILFGAEEIGMYGSYHFANNMGLWDIDNTIAMMNFDAFGSGTKLGITGDTDLIDAAEQFGAERDIPLFHRVRTRWAGDHAPFLRDGIPVFRVLSNGQGRINSPEDDIEHINPDMLGYASEIGIGVLDWLAENHEDW